MLTMQQAADLNARIQAAHAGQGRLEDVVLPNGRKLGDCPDDYLRGIGAEMMRLAYEAAPPDDFGHA